MMTYQVFDEENWSRVMDDRAAGIRDEAAARWSDDCRRNPVKQEKKEED